ncbi:glutamate receptor 2.7-like [Coffea arabica]|uniref:Glutamate receptor n=1 Tax=Coffea arabica TaxID=13443 RepID=A0A6P6UMI6_COFAR|nr:glutamate receptor 2.7-like [Coffea arabica]
MRCPVIIIFFLGFFATLILESKATADEKSIQYCPVNQRAVMGSVGGIFDQSSRVGKEQAIAVEMAVHDFNRWSHCSNLALHSQDSKGNSARAVSAVTELVNKKQAQVIIGQLTLQEATLLWDFDKVAKDIPVISTVPTATSPPFLPSQPPSFIRMTTDTTLQMQGIAAIIGQFRWRRVIAVYEHSNSFSADSGLITHLADSLWAVEAGLEYYSAFPRVVSQTNPQKFIEEELSKLRTKNIKVFTVLQASLEFAVMLFEKAKKLGMMNKGYVWIVMSDVANLLDSVQSSVLLNHMQGVIGLKTKYLDTSDSFRTFELRFRRRYGSEYPEEEKHSSPSIYALQAYDATWALAKAIQKSEKNGLQNSTNLGNSILSSNFEGLSGIVSFKNGALLQKPVYQLVNVIGKSYQEIAIWSPDEFGLSEDRIKGDGTNIRIGHEYGKTWDLGTIIWPGGQLAVPKGMELGSTAKPLRIGVPAKGAFNQFVNVTFDQLSNETTITGFTIQVFDAVVKRLPYHLHYVLVPYSGSYDQMVDEVHNKSFYAAIGDIEIMANRYEIADFSQPYLDSGLVMVVAVKPDTIATKILVLKAFKLSMWTIMAAMTMYTGVTIWLYEHANENPDFGGTFPQNIRTMLWYSVTVLSFANRETIRSNLSRLVLQTWLFVTLVVTACFTASVTTLMTSPRNKPSIGDIDYLLATNAPVGCNGNSFIDRFLIDALHFRPENIRKIGSLSEYPGKFESGEIKAAFFVAPHAKIYLAEHCKGYTMAGPSIKLGGFGFVFQKGSPLAADISEAILKVTQTGTIDELEKHMFSFSTCSSSSTGGDHDQGQGPDGVGIEPFFVLFLVSGGLLALASLNAILRLLKKHLANHGFINGRVLRWASLLLARAFTKSGTTLLRKTPIIQRPNNEINMHRNELEPDLRAIELATNVLS